MGFEHTILRVHWETGNPGGDLLNYLLTPCAGTLKSHGTNCFLVKFNVTQFKKKNIQNIDMPESGMEPSRAILDTENIKISG